MLDLHGLEGAGGCCIRSCCCWATESALDEMPFKNSSETGADRLECFAEKVTEVAFFMFVELGFLSEGRSCCCRPGGKDT